MNHTYSRESLTRIKEGMEVVDSAGHRVGSVKYFQFGDENPLQPGVETTAIPHDQEDASFVENVAEALVGEIEMSEELRARLLRHGYIQIDSGPFSGDYFAVMNQVAHVTLDRVTLNVSREALIKP